MKKVNNFYIFYTLCCLFIFLRLEIFYGSDIRAPFTDDFYYYLTTAKNYINLGVVTFDKISLTNGFQPLWFLIITLVYFVFPNDIIFNCIIIGLIFLLTLFSYINFRKYFTQNNYKMEECELIASIIAYLSLFFSKNGMEVSLAIFFFSWSLLYLKSNILLCSLLCFLTFLSRLEFIIFYFVIFVNELFLNKKILNISFLLKLSLLPLLIFIYLLTNIYFFGVPLPQSGIAKSLNQNIIFNKETFSFLFADGYGMKFITLMFYFNCLGLIFLFTNKLKNLTKLSIITNIIFFSSNSLRSAWPLWTWHFFFFSISTGLLLNDFLNNFKILYKASFNILIGVFFTVSYLFLFIENFNINNDHMLNVAKKIDKYYSNENNKIFAMGDMAGKVSYLLDKKLIQLEGLVGGNKVINKIKSEESLCKLFNDLEVDIYLTNNAKKDKNYYYVSEPSQKSKNIRKMRAILIDDNPKIFLSGDLKIYAFDLKSNTICKN